ncbi:MAG: hypothetical protein JO345_31415 [Streptosporangiaceae bacterium]|nr:hypothetical protein [Streptosporangiaceae bacterium]
MRSKRTWLIGGIAGALAVVMAGSGTAYASTSHEWVFHANGRVAGEVWYNAANSNLSKGWNSFTVKDEFCGDGWSVGVQWATQSGNWEGAPHYVHGDCQGGGSHPDETSFSITDGHSAPGEIVTWRGCKESTTDGSIECEAWVHDKIG